MFSFKSKLNKQEVCNERLAMQLQQRYWCIVIILFFSHFTRPEADGIKAMQSKQLLSILMMSDNLISYTVSDGTVT